MTAGFASIAFILLFTVSIAQFIWAFGGTWPAADSQSLARTVIGQPGISRMPSRLVSFLVGLLILATGIWVLLLSGDDKNLTITLGGLVIGAVALLRGIATYLPQWRRLTPEEPFATLDRKFYGPTALAIGIIVIGLCIWRLS